MPRPPFRRLLVPSAALWWGLQLSFLNPALAFLLVGLFDATPTEVGVVLALYNASGFVASLVVPVWADRRGEYVLPMVASGVLTAALAVVLALVTALPPAVVALVVLGGPAGVGSSLLFAHLKNAGAGAEQVVRTRAVFSAAWIAGPPLATVLLGYGVHWLLAAVVVIAALNVVTTLQLRRGVAVGAPEAPAGPGVPWRGTALVAVAFVAVAAANSAAVSVMSLFVTQRLGLDVVWAGIVLGVSAGLEIPALLLLGRLTARFGDLPLVLSGCLAGTAYYLGVVFVAVGPVSLLALQALNAWFFAISAGVGLTMFQRIIPRPGLAVGVFGNVRKVGQVIAGPVIAVGSSTHLGYGGVFAVCAGLTTVALLVVLVSRRAVPELSARPA
ncbi:MFS transporter [Kineococcus endophyticus]|uniref:MFS transporter n=1 Tax=Kineococcus endophyticus TaxID=1181883 RepID=A0ABV3P872_9ACTN